MQSVFPKPSAGTGVDARSDARASPPAVGLLVVLVALLSCGNPNAPRARLEGSLTTVMDLGFDESVLTFAGTEFSVAFRRKKGMGFDTVLAVTTRLEAMPLPDGGVESLRAQTYDLTDVLSNGVVRGTVSRQVLDDPRTMFPELRVGKITFLNIPQQGAGLPAVGEFNVTFENGVEFASGKTCFSSFQAQFP
ncbi:MAG: hypothetical protein JNK82_21315 [Myxococcaceae bacterium]|nr:hypothetical protein [Myxococcaceae bacterium]